MHQRHLLYSCGLPFIRLTCTNTDDCARMLMMHALHLKSHVHCKLAATIQAMHCYLCCTLVSFEPDKTTYASTDGMSLLRQYWNACTQMLIWMLVTEHTGLKSMWGIIHRTFTYFIESNYGLWFKCQVTVRISCYEMLWPAGDYTCLPHTSYVLNKSKPRNLRLAWRNKGSLVRSGVWSSVTLMGFDITWANPCARPNIKYL